MAKGYPQHPDPEFGPQQEGPPEPRFLPDMIVNESSFCSMFLAPQKGHLWTKPFVYSSTVPQTSNSLWQLSQTKSYAGILLFSFLYDDTRAMHVDGFYGGLLPPKHLHSSTPVDVLVRPAPRLARSKSQFAGNTSHRPLR